MSGRGWVLGAAAVMFVMALSGAVSVERGGLEDGPSAPGPEGPGPRAKVDINTAPAADLERLPGMNRKLSERIMVSRPYQKIDDLVRRKVLGRKQLAAIKEYITVGTGGGEGGRTPSR